MPELIKSVPRVKATPIPADPEMMHGVSEKGGISVYGLQRFPVTLYLEQWERLFACAADILAYGMENAASLSDGRPLKVSKTETGENRTINVLPEELALVDAAIATAKDALDMDTAVKYATIKATASRNGGKLPVEDMLAVYSLKARK